MNNLPMYVERALAGRCAGNRRLRSTAIKLYEAASVAWDQERGEIEGDIEVKVCGDECHALWDAGEMPS